MKCRFVDRIDAVDPNLWNGLIGADTPFTSHAYLAALEHSGCVAAATGWHPHHLILERDGELVAAMPGYIKDHSYGEYVFDWSWADALHQLGSQYYPKLLVAIPFTPVPGPRLLLAPGVSAESALHASITGLQQEAQRLALSSLHLLFAGSDLTDALAQGQLLHRQAVQFVWHNRGYTDFDQFLADLKSSKRKQIRRERARVAEQGICVQRLQGDQLQSRDLDFFLRCYQDTYLRHSGHRGYLNDTFFRELWEAQRQHMMLVIATREAKPLASALFFFDQQQLYGRYWGTLEEVDCLHFELCYYQGIEFAIAQGLQQFNPGTQGEHKLVRGFYPTRSHSFHWLAERVLHQAVTQALIREAEHVERYAQAAERHLPFRNDR